MADPEHMEMLERVKSQGGKGPAPLPPLSTWTPEVDMMANVNDTLMLVKDAIIRSNVPKAQQKSIPDVKFTPRPGRPERATVTEQDRAEQQARHAKAVSLFHPDAARRESVADD